MGETGKEREVLKASHPKRNFINEEDLTVSSLGAFIDNPSYKIPKKTKAKAIIGGQNKKKTKK